MVVTQTNRLPQTAHTGRILDDRFLMPDSDASKTYGRLRPDLTKPLLTSPSEATMVLVVLAELEL
jgi:hypothetical protein